MVSRLVTLIGILLFCTKCGAEPTCLDSIQPDYLDASIEFIDANSRNNVSRNALDCSDLLVMGHKKSGVYKVWPQSRLRDNKPLVVNCDMETAGGGWTLIQRRGSYGRSQDYFFKDWKSYKEGFGDMDKDFWLGNDNIFALTNQRLYSARFDLKDMNKRTSYAHYDTFWIDDENHKYALHIADYRGDAGDSMIQFHNNRKFSTMDQDNAKRPERNCSGEFKGGWWYNDINCYAANLNGYFMSGSKDYKAMHWKWTSDEQESLLSCEIKIRPKSFEAP